MSILSFFSTGKTSKIENCKKQIESYKLSIETEKFNMSRSTNYNTIEACKKRIASHKSVIASYRKEIDRLNKK